uniref:Shieldin complex subunit 2 n=1 Tax=Amphiprion percula TaxID=161767 RepID=A0A3P8SM96_AMPPE
MSCRGAGAGLTSLAGRPVLAVLSPVALDHLPLPAVSLDGEADAQDVVTRLDDPQDPEDSLPLLLGALPGLQVLHQLVLHDSGTLVEEAFHHGEEVGVIVPVHGLAVAAVPQQGRGRRQRGVRGGGAARGQDVAGSPDSMCDRPKIHVFLGAPPPSSCPASAPEAGMVTEDHPPAGWRHLELTWRDGRLRPAADELGNEARSSREAERTDRDDVESQSQDDPISAGETKRGQEGGAGKLNLCSNPSSPSTDVEPGSPKEDQCSASVHEYLDSCFPTAQTGLEKPGLEPEQKPKPDLELELEPESGPGPGSDHQPSPAVPPLSIQTHYLTTWTLSQALILRGRHTVQSASSSEKTPPKHSYTPPSVSSSTPELFSPATPSPGASAELFSHPCPSPRTEEGGVILEATTDGVLCSQESRTVHDSPIKSPRSKRARISEDSTTEAPDSTTTTGLQSPTTLLARCDKAGVRYSILVAVVYPSHLKEVQVKSGPSAGTFVPLASIVVTDQSGVEMKVVLWRRAAFWTLTLSPGDLLLITGLQVHEDRWRGETVLQSTFSSKLLNLGQITASTSPPVSQHVAARSLSSLCGFLREQRPLLASLPRRPPQDLSRLPYATLRSLRVNMLVHALLRVTHTHISSEWRSEAESRSRSAVQLKAVVTVEQPGGQQGALLLWGSAVDWLPRFSRDRATVWDFHVLLVRDGLTSNLPELHSTPWSSVRAVDKTDSRVQDFHRTYHHQKDGSSGDGTLELDIDTLLSQKYSGEVELRVQLITFRFQDALPSQNAPQPVLDSSTPLDGIVDVLSGDITYTGCGRCSAELDTDANGIYSPCYPCLPHTAVRRYYRPGVLTVSGRGCSQVCVQVPPVPLQKILEAPPDRLHRSSAPGSEVKLIQVAAERIQTLLRLPRKTFVITIRSHFLCDENSVPISQDFTLLDLQFPS